MHPPGAPTPGMPSWLARYASSASSLPSRMRVAIIWLQVYWDAGHDEGSLLAARAAGLASSILCPASAGKCKARPAHTNNCSPGAHAQQQNAGSRSTHQQGALVHALRQGATPKREVVCGTSRVGVPCMGWCRHSGGGALSPTACLLLRRRRRRRWGRRRRWRGRRWHGQVAGLPLTHSAATAWLPARLITAGHHAAWRRCRQRRPPAAAHPPLPACRGSAARPHTSGLERVHGAPDAAELSRREVSTGCVTERVPGGSQALTMAFAYCYRSRRPACKRNPDASLAAAGRRLQAASHGSSPLTLSTRPAFAVKWSCRPS